MGLSKHISQKVRKQAFEIPCVWEGMDWGWTPLPTHPRRYSNPMLLVGSYMNAHVFTKCEALTSEKVTRPDITSVAWEWAGVVMWGRVRHFDKSGGVKHMNVNVTD